MCHVPGGDDVEKKYGITMRNTIWRKRKKKLPRLSVSALRCLISLSTLCLLPQRNAHAAHRFRGMRLTCTSLL